MEEMHRAKYVGRTQSSLTFPRYLRILTNLKACQIPFFRFGRGFIILGFPGSSDGKEPASNAREPGSVTALGRSSEGGHGNPLQPSCLENPHGQRSLVGYSPWGRKESDTTEQLSTARHAKETYFTVANSAPLC